MKAIVFDHYGAPDVLHEAEVATPVAGPAQVRIRVAAAGYNPVDAKLRSGMMQALWPMTLPAILGTDVAGVVDQVGAGVNGVAVGDEVLGWAEGGCYAEYALARKVARKPGGLAWATAAALPVTGEAAQRVLTLLDVQEGETLLIHGAAGGVGTIAVQLAVRRGATVIGTASVENLESVRELGAMPVVYGEGLVERVRALAPQGVDAVLDAAGAGALPASIELRGGTSRIVTLADMNAQSLGVRFAAGTADDQSPSALATLAHLVAEGALRISIAATYPLAQAAEAHRAAAARRGRGKIVLLVD